jgi:NADPH2:quinone reductase
MVHAIVVHSYGGPEELRFEEKGVDAPGPGELLIRQTAVGLNFVDVYQRTGLYPHPLPFVPGSEGVGIVEAIGPDVSDVSLGDRVAYASMTPGAYAEKRVIPASQAVPLPSGIRDDVAAASMLKGLTAQYLLRQTLDLEPGDTIVFHAAAGGTGLFACQWARHLGLRVIGVVGSAAKAGPAKDAGCESVIDLSSTPDFPSAVKTLTHGKGVRAVFDSVGKNTFEGSLACLQPWGTLVSFGQASGVVPPFDIRALSKNSLFLTRPSLGTYVGNRDRLLAMAADLFEVLASGAVKVEIRQRYRLAEAATAHRDLEGRRTVGASVLLP